MLPETNSLAYTPSGSANDPLNSHGLNLIHRVSDTSFGYFRGTRRRDASITRIVAAGIALTTIRSFCVSTTSQHGFKASMSGKGNCYDNAVVETFFKTIKAELLWQRTWETRRTAEMAIFEYINGFYNPRRRHSALGWKSPLAFKAKAA